MSSDLNHQSWITGLKQKTTTLGGATPPLNGEWYPGGGDLDASFSSCTITAETVVTYGAITYAAGDVLFSSDSDKIYDSTGAVMNGSPDTGGWKGVPQGVSIVKVIDSLSSSIGKEGELFWVFTNSLSKGLVVGLIDMTGNGGLGTFADSNSSGLTPSGGALGTVKGSEDGMCGRMITCCKRDNDDLDLVIGTIVIYKSVEWSGHWEDNGWMANAFTQIAANGFPDITAVNALPVNSPVGITVAAGNNAGVHGTVCITPQNNNILDPLQDHYKIATIYREAVGTQGTAVASAFMEVLTFNQDSLAILNPTTKLTAFIDRGPTGFPVPSSYHSRFYAMDMEFSHSSTHDNAYLYYPYFEDQVPGGTLEVRWNEIDNNNTWHPTNKGEMEILDNLGMKIWGGPSTPGRILAGMWRDPGKLGRIFVSTPEQVDSWSITINPNTPVWSADYPEVYGTLSSSPNVIQHCILEDCDTPVITAPLQSMVGTLDVNTYYQYGSPSFTVCSFGAGSNELFIGKCAPVFSWSIDSTNNLWKTVITAVGATVNQVTNISLLTNFISINHDRLRDMLYIWDAPTGTNSLRFRKYNTDTNTITSPTSIGGGALGGYDKINAVDSNAYLLPSAPGATNPTADGDCIEHNFIGLKSGSTELFSIGIIDASANTVTAYNATFEIDITNDHGGVLAGKIPTHMTTARNINAPQTFISYVTFGDRIAYCDGSSGAWTLLASASPGGDYTSLHFRNITATTNPTLYATAGGAGANKIYTINIVTGAATLIGGVGDILTDPGGFVWPDLMVGATYQNGFRYYELSPLKIDSVLNSVEYPIYASICKNTYDVWQQPHPQSDHVGCFKCVPDLDYDTDHLLSTQCSWYDPGGIRFTECRDCIDALQDDCMAFLPCCNVYVGASSYGLGPMELPGIAINNAGSFVPGNIYDISIGGSTPVCTTAITPMEEFWFSHSDGNIYQIDGPFSSGVCSIPAWATTHGPFSSLEDIAFDKHGNVIYTEGPNSISWASVWPGYESAPELITNTFTVPLCLDTDYTASNHIVGADMVTGVASFRTYTNSVGVPIALVTTVTNSTISLGHDLSVDFNSGDYYTLGDVTGAGGLDDLMSIDDTTGTHTLVSNLVTVCSFAGDQHAYGIERVRYTGATSLTYILSAKYIGINNYELYFHELNDTGTAQLSVLPLLNPASATNSWPSTPTGLAYSDICSKWPGNVDPPVSPWVSCDECLADPSTEDCCYELTNCDTFAVQHSTQTLLNPYVGMVIRLINDTCWEVERIPTCISPVSVTPHATPGPFVDCPACTPDPEVCYELPSCCDPADIVYTNDTLTPSIAGIYAGGYAVQLPGECFCRSIIINTPCTGTEVAITIQNTLPDCGNYCKWNINLINCVTGVVVSVDWCTSPTVVAAAGGSEAYEITVGGIVPDAVNLCWEKIDPCQGPTNTTYPIGIITATHTDCTVCANAGQYCVLVDHCCGDTYVTQQVVNVTTGITVADIGFVVQADITVGATIYTGCWEVSANSPVGDCVGALPNANVNAINTATVGAGNMLDCTYCPVTPCPPACTLLESCQNPGTFITVDGATGATIGSDVVTLGGYPDCWKVCGSQGNPIAGSQWFYGQSLGIDFTSGAPVPDFNGASQMLTYNSANTLMSDSYSFRGTAIHCATGAATIGGNVFAAGDLMFYTDGHLIYDSTHTLMNTDAGPTHRGDANVGGVSVNGRTFPAQGALVIPVAGGGVTNNVWHQYYVIQNSCDNGPIKWSIVDMTLNGGKGEVLDASKNTTLVANACEYMCVSTTQGLGAVAYWHLFYLPVMATNADAANCNISAIKFDAVGPITPLPTPAVDITPGLWDTSNTLARSSGEILINQSNNIITFRYTDQGGGNNDAYTTFVWGLDPATASSSTAILGVTVNTGYNGGANNGVFHWIVGGMFEEQIPISGTFTGMNAINLARTLSFSPDGTKLWATLASYYDPGTPFEIADPISGFRLMCLDVHSLGQVYFATQNFMYSWNIVNDPATAFTAPNHGWFNGLPFSPDYIKMFPDASEADGWYGSPTVSDRCTVMVNDITFAPDGKLWLNVVEQELNMPWSQAVGAGAQITNSLIRFDAPNFAQGATDNLSLAVPMPAYDIGARRMGERFPVWLQMPCPCDPINIVPVTITSTLPDCATCAPQPPGCYLLTECECTGGSSGPNPCSVNDPMTMPPNMILYGKTWSPTCLSGVPVRWQAIVDAVQLLGTANPPVPGTNQTITWSYSLINGGATFSGMPGGFGPSQTITVANGPGATGINASCNVYNKTYGITDLEFQAEMAAMFAYIKDFFEGMFNTSCGYGADLTVNFTALGYETGYTAGDNALASISNPGNGTSFTDVNGVAGIGDFRVGLSDFGGLESCGPSGNALQILGLCFNSNLNNCDPGVNKAGGHSGQLLFDANENWRRAGDPVVANSFSLIRVGIHEILHAFGFGHDWLTFGSNAACICPCYQSAPGCPSMYPPPGGALYNPDALMGPFSTTAPFLTDFPGGLMGVNGMYDRRAMCGIYGNNSVNYACEDGVCLQGAGCVYITHYSDDPVLAGYVGGIITWDDGSAAGERCWEVEAVNPCPAPPPPLVNPVAPIGVPSGPTLTCLDCDPVNPCYVLNLCACDTTPGAPPMITTDTDLSVQCGTGQVVVEVDLYPNACYEIDCTPITCPGTGVVTVVVTNAYPDCATCCMDNTMCYQLCPCGPSVTSDTCSTLTEINVGVSTGAGQALQFISDVANAPLNATDMTTLKYGNNIQPGGSLPCVAPGGGFYRSFPGVLPNSGTFVCYQAGTSTPPPGLAAGYNTWTDFLADCVTLGIAGVVNPGTPYFGINMLINTHFGYSTGVTFGISSDPCECTAASVCTVVTNDLSLELGQVITIGPGAPGTLDTDGVDCYEVELCGVCGTGLCNPIGAVTVVNTYPNCPACESPQGCDCYRLIDCTDPNIIINNVCQTAALDTAFINGDIIQINGNTAQCWHIECDSPLVCDPITCVVVAITATFVNCQACLGTQLWECEYVGSCNCVPHVSGSGNNAYVDCVTMFANEPTCCPTQIGVNCENVMGTCTCVPCFVGPCDYNTGVPPTDMLACVSDMSTCCGPAIPESYNCIWDQALSIYTCIDPGNGTGTFLGPTSFVDCTNCVSSNCPDCYIESWDCITVLGVSTCVDPGTGLGDWNNGNGGLAACVACNGCPIDPTCVGVISDYECHPIYGCIVNWNGQGGYPTLADCALECDSYDPNDGTFEADCENCLNEIEMKHFFDKVADVCDDCNVPFGLTDQEVTCDTGCFGQSNIYVFLDITSTFGGTYLNRLQEAVNFKVNIIEPAFQQIKTEFPQYNGHLYIIPGAWPYGTLFGPCSNSNGTMTIPPGSPTAPEDWLAWASYPLSGNVGANGGGANPMATGTLPGAQRTVMGQTMVDGIGGPPVDCNGAAYDASVHGPLLEQLMILPGSYTTDGFTQLNPWQDGVGKEGMSDPYHEFEGKDIDSIVVIFQDESRTPGVHGYYEDAVGSNQFGGLCGAVTWAGTQPVLSWHGWGTDPGNLLAPQWKTDYNNYMSLHEFGWDAAGVPNPAPWVVTQKTMIYAGSWDTPSTHVSKIGFIYHLFGAVGAQSSDANINFQGQIDCADYVGVPASFGYQCYVATDQTLPANDVANPYMGASGGGDPSLVTGYQGGSLSNYGMAFHIPDAPIAQLTSTNLYELWKEYLSDCE